jgi:hypothetical protein
MIAELRAMLKDRINNHLTIVLMSVTQRRDSRISPLEQEMLQAAIVATAAVSRTLDELSMESLRRWKARYEIEVVRTPVAEARSRQRNSGPKTEVGR